MRRPRPDNCPDCGASVSHYTGTYCHACGFVLVDDERPLPRRGRNARDDIARETGVVSDETVAQLRASGYSDERIESMIKRKRERDARENPSTGANQ